MSDNTHSRRRVLAGTGSLVSIAVAGCIGELPDDDQEADPGNETPGDDEDGAQSSSSENEPYTVSMPPVGEVTFEEPPERFIGYEGLYMDIAAGIGVIGRLEGMMSDYSAQGFQRFYAELPNVSVPLADERTDPEEEDIVHMRDDDDNTLRQELVYEMDPDLIALDPTPMADYGGLSDQDIENLEERVAPFLGNESQRTRDEERMTAGSDEPYPYVHWKDQTEIRHRLPTRRSNRGTA